MPPYRHSLFFLGAFPVAAAQGPVLLDPVEVVAPPLQDHRTKITQDTLKKKGNPPFAFEALRGEPGVTAIQQGGVGAPTTVSLRGLGSNHTLVTLQDIPINTAASLGNQSYYYLFPTQFLDHMTLERGVSGVSHGPNAMGGVVTLVPKKGPETNGVQTTISGESGSFGTVKTGLGQGYRQGDSAFYGGLSHFQTDGLPRTNPPQFGQKNRFTQDSFLVNGTTKPTEVLTVDAFAYGTHHRLHGDTFPLSDQRTITNFYDTLVGAKATLDPLGHQVRHCFQVAHHDLSTRATEGHFRQRSQVNHGRYQASWTPVTAHTITGGGQVDREHLHDPKNVTRSLTNPAAFLTHRGIWGPVETHLGTRLYHHEKFGTHSLYGGGLRLHTPWHVDFLGNLGTGFRPPTLQDLYGQSAFATPNPHLKPEKNRMGEVGLEARHSGLTLGIRAFENHTRHLIELEQDQGKFRPMNRGKTKSQGAEIKGEWAWNAAWSATLSHTQTHARDGRRVPLLHQPRHQTFAALHHRPVAPLLVSLEAGLVSKTHSKTVNGQPIGLKSHKIVNMNATYTLAPGRQVFVRFTNVFNRHYQVVSGYATPPRALQGGFAWTL